MSDNQYKLGGMTLLDEYVSDIITSTPAEHQSVQVNDFLNNLRSTFNQIVWKWVRVNYDRPIYSGKILGIFSFTVYVKNVTNLIAIIVGPET